MRAVRLLVWCAGGVWSAAMIAGAIDRHLLPAGAAAAGYGAVFAAITIGVLVWEVRPEHRTGILLTAIPFAVLANDLNVVFRGSRLAVTMGWATAWIAAALITHLILSYPSGRLGSRLDRAWVALGYVLALGYGLVFMLFYSPRSTFDPQVWDCPRCAVPYTHVAWLDLRGLDRVFEHVVVGFALVLLALLVRKLIRVSPGGRQVLYPLLFAASFIVVEFTVQIVAYGHSVNSWTNPAWFWIVTAAPLSLPVALALGLLWGGRARPGGGLGRRARAHATRVGPRRARADARRSIPRTRTLATGPPHLCRRSRSRVLVPSCWRRPGRDRSR